MIEKELVPLHCRKTKIVQWCNGSTSDSGSACEGSSPSWTTRIIANFLSWRLLFFFCLNVNLYHRIV